MTKPNVSTKDSLVTVAARLFRRFGYHKTSMDEIAKTARKAKGSLYYHFSSKEELFEEVLNREFDILRNELQKITEDESLAPFEKLKAFLSKRVEVLSTSYNYHETLKADFFEQLTFVNDLRENLMEWEKEQMTRIVQEGMDAGVFVRSVKVGIAIEIFTMMEQGLEVPFFVQNRYEDFAPHLDSLINIIVKGISV